MKKHLCLTFLTLLSYLSLHAQQDIAAARAMNIGSAVSISGIVTSGPELGTIRFMQDASAGIGLYSMDVVNLVRGDSVTVTGTLKEYNNLLELDPISSVVLHSSGHDLPQAVMLTPSAFAELYEGMLVAVDQAVIGGSGVFQRDAYPFTASGESGQLYVNDPLSPLVGSPIPSGPVILTGPLGAYYDTYQILPRDMDDLRSYSSIQLTSAPLVSQLSTSGFTLGWSTDVEGTSEALVGLSPELELGPLKLGGTRLDHSLSIDGRNPSEFFYIQAFSVHDGDTAWAALQTVITVSESSGSFRALFNRAVDPSVSLGLLDAEYLPDGIDDELIAYIDQATESIEVAIYNLDNDGISDITGALNNAHNRGVVVRVVYDRDVNAQGVQGLLAGIGKQASPYSDYPHYGIMHHKFVLIDALSSDPLKPIVWTGSTNLTDKQIDIDPNNVLVIQDQSLAKAYQLEFNEMFGSSGPMPDPAKARFGPDKKDNTPHEFIIGGKRVECYFSPSDGTHQQILNAMATTDHNARVATMLMTKMDLANRLVSLNEAGKDIQVLLHNYEQYGEPVLDVMKASLRSDVRLNGSTGIMHHKYMLVDQDQASSDPLVLTGSHNWSSSAQLRNDENTLIIHDQGVANAYYQEFVMRFAAGEILVSREDQQMPEAELSVRIYPNPASTWIRLEGEAGADIKALSIIDPAGRVLQKYQGPIPDQIPVHQLPSGPYLFKFTLGSSEHFHSLVLIR